MKKVLMSKIMVILLVLGLVFTIVSIRPNSEVNAAGPIYRVVPDGLTTEDCGDTWANACDLQYALATKSLPGDELWIKAGTYKPTTETDRTVSFVLKDGVALYGGFGGSEEGRDERDWQENVTILSGDIGTLGNSSDNSYHVVTGVTGATLDGFTITAGTANGSDPQNNGGGMRNDNANPTLTNVTFSGNTASSYGGGMSNWNSSSPTLTNITFSGNYADNGGGMYNDNANPTLTNVTFSGNSASSYGGGMYNLNNSSPTLTDATFSGNTASSYGGGMYNRQSSPTLTNIIFSDNSAYSGGGMYNFDSNLKLENATIYHNTAQGLGGGINTMRGNFTLSHVTFSDNTCSIGIGGGMYNNFFGATIITASTFSDVTFSGNSAGAQAGGLNNEGFYGTMTDVTFSGNSAGDDGGGMFCSSCQGVLEDITFSGNSTDEEGGGIAITGGIDKTLTLTNMSFTDNSAKYGGGMAINFYTKPTLEDITFSGNTAIEGGGGIYIRDNAKPTLTDITFSDNTAENSGGGMYCFAESSPTLTNVSFSNNRAYNMGGGVYSEQCSSTLTDVSFVQNEAISGGGMFNSANNPTLKNIAFSGNHAYFGGGIYNAAASIPVLTNVSFSGNNAVDGAGMYNIDSSNPTLTNVVFSGNDASYYGGGVYNKQSSPAINNTILWGDSAANGAEIYNYDVASIPQISTSDIQGCGGSGAWNPACGTDGGGNLDADPLLGALGDYGGFTQTLPLLPGSAAIDTGDDTICPESDQRGVARPQGAGCDMGAYESRGFTLTKNSGDDQAAFVNTPFAEPLVVGVSGVENDPVDGGVVTFTAPLSGPSAIPQTSTVVISEGLACQSLTASGEGGEYSVMVDTAGAVEPSIFMLKNFFGIYLPVIIR